MADSEELIGKDYNELSIALLGEENVGKTSIMNRFIGNPFREEYKTTLNPELNSKEMRMHDLKINLQIWDFPTKEKYKSLIKIFIKKVKGFIFVYDISNRKSFEELKNWIQFANENSEKFKSIIVGNKTDLYEESEVREEEASKLAENFGFPLYLVSAKEGNGRIDEIFETLVKEIIDDNTIIVNPRKIKLKKDNDEFKKRKGGCCGSTQKRIVKVSKCERCLTCIGWYDCLRYFLVGMVCCRDCFCGEHKCSKEAWEECAGCVCCLGCQCSYCCRLKDIDEENKCCHCFHCPKTRVEYYGGITAPLKNFWTY